MTDSLQKTDRTTITRHGERASYDRSTAYAILDEALVAHVGFEAAGGVTVLPMTYARIDDELFLHGAAASRWLSEFEGGKAVSVCVTLLDGLVLAQSAFSHSMNYRSVVCFGDATVVADPARKQAVFKAFLDHIVPGRWHDSRQPDAREIAATTVLSLPLREASVKIRSGPSSDMGKDHGLGYWTGVIPLALTAGAPQPDPWVSGKRPTPAYVEEYTRGSQSEKRTEKRT